LLIELQIPDYCREIEAYLCRKNDGHLIRVTGPSFDLVAGWARRGVPIKVAFKGIDRYFERYYRQGPRRRPVRIDFCEADVLEAFDSWRRAVGIAIPELEATDAESRETDPDARAVTDRMPPAVSGVSDPGMPNHEFRSMPAASRQSSLPEHLKRVVLRLTSARAGALDQAFDALIDRVSTELDRAQHGRGLRGTARQALIDRLEALDREFLQQARAMLDEDAGLALSREADGELGPFRGGMSPDAFARAREAAIDRLVRERYNLPLIAYRHA
jgi:hypothetical protein